MPAMRRVTTRAKYMYGPSREFVRFEKGFLLHFPVMPTGVTLLDAAKQLKMGSDCMSFLQIPSIGGCGLRKSDSQE